MYKISFRHYVDENLDGNYESEKIVVAWYNLVNFFNHETYIVPVIPFVIIFWHQQYDTCPLILFHYM